MNFGIRILCDLFQRGTFNVADQVDVIIVLNQAFDMILHARTASDIAENNNANIFRFVYRHFFLDVELFLLSFCFRLCSLFVYV